MKHIILKAVGVSLGLATLVIGVSPVFAQYYYPSSSYTAYPTSYYTNNDLCSLRMTLSPGLRDSTTAGAVSQVQNFLVSQGYLRSNLATGYYGTYTSQAVKRYQLNHELPATGNVDSQTLAAMQNYSCGNSYSNNYYYNNGYNTNYNNSYCYNQYTGQYYYCSNYYNNNFPYYNQTPVVNIISPNPASIGSSVTIYGYNFSPTNNSVNIAGSVISNLSSNGNYLTFTLPYQLNTCQYYWMCYGNTQPLVPGNYNITVTNGQGYTSNAVSLTVNNYNNNYCNNNYYNNGYYNNCNSGNISIQSINGPTNLSVGSQGNWNLVLNNYNYNNSYLTTTVHWGDENQYVNNAQTPQSTYAQGQQTQSFTHVYNSPGTYTITFTIRDNYGNQNVVTSTVNVQ